MTLLPSLFCDTESPDIAADSSSSYAATRPNMVSSDILCEIEKLVNYAIRRIAKSWNLSETDCEDLYQDAVIAGIEAYHRFDSTHNRKLQNWLLDRIIGQLKDSVQRLRSGGVVGGKPIVLPLDGSTSGFDEPTPSDGIPGRTLSVSRWNVGGDALGSDSPIEPIDSSSGPAERAEIAQLMEILGERLGTVDKLALSLYYGLNGGKALTVVQLAEQLGCSKDAAWQRLRRARLRAREILLSGEPHE